MEQEFNPELIEPIPQQDDISPNPLETQTWDEATDVSEQREGLIRSHGVLRPPAGTIIDTGIENFSTPLENTVSISSAEILALGASPKELIAAPASGTAIVVEEYVHYFDYGTIQYANGSRLDVIFAGGSIGVLGNNVATGIPIADITGASNVIRGHGSEGTQPPISSATAVQLKASGAEFITGDGTLKIFIKYRIITL